MGYKNSIDSATLVNKCLELIEAHYLFNISFNKLDILIHPQSLVHSIIEGSNYVSKMIYFHNDMKIPLINFLDNAVILLNFQVLKNLIYCNHYILIFFMLIKIFFPCIFILNQLIKLIHAI